MTTVGLVTMATGRYVEFIPELVSSAREHLAGLGPVFVLTDAATIDGVDDVCILPWEKLDWPLPTLLRYRAFCQYAKALAEVDVLLYTDADMLFVGPVDVRDATELIAVRHPGYVDTVASELPYERRAVSTAFVPHGQGDAYFCGGVQGGRSTAYLAAANVIDRAIAEDQAKGVTAVWHDESQWNRYLLDHPAEIQLSADYCTPDVQRTEASRILAITKNHSYFREYSKLQRSVNAVRHLQTVAMRRARRVWRFTLAR